MESKNRPKIFSPPKSRSRWPRWIFVFPLLGFFGLLLTAVQLFPHLEAYFWKRQLADAPSEQVEFVLDQIVGLGDGGIPVLVESLASDREAVASSAKRRLLELMESWKSLPAEEHSSHLNFLATALARQAKSFGPTARSDASEIASQILLESKEIPNERSRLIAACDDVFQAATAVRGESSLASAPVYATSSPRFGDDRSANRAVAVDRSDLQKNAAMQFDPLPGGGLPLVDPPVEKKPNQPLPGENSEVPPGFFQEPEGTRSLEFSNRTDHPLQVPEAGDSRNKRKAGASVESRQIKSMSLESSDAENDAAKNLKLWDTMKIMRQLADADEEQTKLLQAELQRRGFTAIEIALAGKLFDSDPAVRKQMIAELPGMADIDAASWLLQCCKDEDADVRLEAFSRLATSTNTILLRKLKVLAESDADARIQIIAKQIREDRIR